MKKYEFTVTIIGQGETIDEAWVEACDALAMDPSLPPDNYTEIEDED